MQFFFIFGALFTLFCLLAASVFAMGWTDTIENKVIRFAIQIAIFSFWVAALLTPVTL